MKIIIDVSAAQSKLKANLAGVYARIEEAIETAANMAASMIEETVRADIQAAGLGSWANGFHVHVEPFGTTGQILTAAHNDPEFGIFETGGTIQSLGGLLWIPLSGTDAVGTRAADYSELFSSRYPRRSGSGRPLLFAVSDKAPRYFGIASVTVPQKVHVAEDVNSVMANFRTIFNSAWRTTNG